MRCGRPGSDFAGRSAIMAGMASFFDADSPSNLTEYSVSELSGSIKRTIETAYDNVRVRGEISGYRGPHSSGHAYFSLKDDRARIDAVVWKGTFGRLKFRPEEGMEVIATGKITTFPGSSKYQIVIEQLEPAGAGALMALLEERKRKLAAEGLFDAGRKQLLPYLPRVIGVVTSPTGAVIRDILHRIADRFPVHVLVWPVKVQGEGSGAEVAAAIQGFNALERSGPLPRPDVLIVARGGGSLEDLWSFNDEIVVRAAAASDIPLISAVGHETDWTLIDHAADVRAPTPTGAAEMAVPVKADLTAQLASLSARLSGAVGRQMDGRRQELRAAARALPALDQLLADPRRRLDESGAALVRALESGVMTARRGYERVGQRLSPEVLRARIAERRRMLGESRLRLEQLTERRLAVLSRPVQHAGTVLSGHIVRLESRVEAARRTVATLMRHADTAIAHDLRRLRAELMAGDRTLQSLSYVNVLKRGFVVVRDAQDRPVTAAHAVSPGMALRLQFGDGDVTAVAGEGGAPPARPAEAPARRKRGGTRPPGDQGSLF